MAGSYLNCSAEDYLAVAKRLGYAVARSANAIDPRSLISAMQKHGNVLMRDVIVGPPSSGAALGAVNSDFWFHTDGCFMPKPPRWVQVFILRAEGGGAVSVLDSTCLRGRLPIGKIRFGNGSHGVEASVVEHHGKNVIFRYREDYMSAGTESEKQLERLHRSVRRLAPKHAIEISDLSHGTCYLVDNWKLLHRRAPFEGKRVIRRLWFGPLSTDA